MSIPSRSIGSLFGERSGVYMLQLLLPLSSSAILRYSCCFKFVQVAVAQCHFISITRSFQALLSDNLPPRASYEIRSCQKTALHKFAGGLRQACIRASQRDGGRVNNERGAAPTLGLVLSLLSATEAAPADRARNKPRRHTPGPGPGPF
jgi:hypothetical protein